jgi:hypothetical protein
MRDFAMPSWLPDSRGNWTMAMPGALIHRNHSGDISTVDGSKVEAVLHREVVRVCYDLRKCFGSRWYSLCSAFPAQSAFHTQARLHPCA